MGKAGDGGIDGIIALDRLGLEKVHVQAKRWKATIGRPEDPRASTAGKRARQGDGSLPRPIGRGYSRRLEPDDEIRVEGPEGVDSHPERPRLSTSTGGASP